jgi:hypothetical protein
VLVHVAAVATDNAPTAGVHVQVTVEQLVDRRARARVTPLVDLREELDANHIRPPLSVRPRRDYFFFSEVVSTAADRVPTSIDTHSQSAAGKGLNASASTATTTRSLGHGSMRHSHHVWCHVAY